MARNSSGVRFGSYKAWERMPLCSSVNILASAMAVLYSNKKRADASSACRPSRFSLKTEPVLAASGASTTAGKHAAQLGSAQRAFQLQLLLTAARAGFLLQFLIRIDDCRIMAPALLARAPIVGRGTCKHDIHLR